MNSKMKAILLAGVFVLLLLSAVAGYNALRAGNAPEAVVFTPKPTAAATPAPETTPEAPAAEATPEATPETTPEAPAAETPAPEDEPEETDEEKAPDFIMLDWDGNEVRFSDFLGKPIVMNFFASWCPPCKEEMPGFDRVYQEYGDEITFIMVDLTDGARETVSVGKAFIQEQGYTFPVYFDHAQEAGYAYGIQAIPLTLLIDARGYIVAGANNAIDEETLRMGIDLLQE